MSDCSDRRSLIAKGWLLLSAGFGRNNPPQQQDANMSSSKCDFNAQNNKYPLVDLSCIKIVDRPQENNDTTQIFYNPRSLGSLTDESLAELIYSLRTDGLQQPPIVRSVMSGNEIDYVELIAGERRIRSIKSIVKNDLSCFCEDEPQRDSYESGETILFKGRFGSVVSQNDDIVLVEFTDDCIGVAEEIECSIDDIFPTVSGRDLYSKIPCKIMHDCSDQRALRVAFAENDNSKPLTIAEEVALVQRLSNSGMKVAEIASILGSNITWVSQTNSFSSELPEEAYKKLIAGEMTRHVAVTLLSYAPENREELYKASVIAEEEDTKARLSALKLERERHEDEAEMMLADAADAEASGDVRAAKKYRKKAASSSAKADKALDRESGIKKTAGKIRQGHIRLAKNATGLNPKKAKSLDKNDIEHTFIDGITPYLEGESVDDVSGEVVPAELAAIVRRTALAIVNGITDPLSPIREYMYDTEQWIRDDDGVATIDEFDEDQDDSDDDDEIDISDEIDRLGGADDDEDNFDDD